MRDLRLRVEQDITDTHARRLDRLRARARPPPRHGAVPPDPRRPRRPRPGPAARGAVGGPAAAGDAAVLGNTSIAAAAHARRHATSPGGQGGKVVGEHDGGPGRTGQRSRATRSSASTSWVPVLGGPPVRYVNLDNAATTPPLRSVVEAVAELLPLYSSVHRGTGYKSRVSTAAYERARQRVGAFVGADPERDMVVFGRHTTDAINLLARSLRCSDRTTSCSRRCSSTTRTTCRGGPGPGSCTCGARPDGTLDLDDLDRLLARHAGRVASAGRHRRLERDRRRAAGARPGRAGARRRRAHPGRRRPARRPPARSTCGPTTTPGTSTSSPCPATRCTPRSAPVP